MIKKFLLMISSLIEKNLRTGEIIGNRYKVVQLLGSGSYGHSYLVFDQAKEIHCVCKTLRWYKRITKSGRTGFFQEIQMLKKIRHPDFPLYYDCGMNGKTPFYTMEYINGHTIEQLIFHEGKTYTEVECFILAKKLLLAIDYLHQQQIVHRDIRIPNIMLEGERLRIIDLGLARQLGTDQNTHTNHPRKQHNIQSDFYGLGHFLLFLLYSSYSPEHKAKNKSWEEELNISNDAKNTIRKLLQIDSQYTECFTVLQDFEEIINLNEGVRVRENVFL
jgi:serine/threonine protein kinase